MISFPISHRPRALRFGAGVVALVALGALGACSGDAPTFPNYSELDVAGSFADTLDFDATTTATITPGRSGPVVVRACAPVGVNLDLAAGGASSSTVSNCERVEFDAVAKQSYDVQLSVVGEGGPVAGCWSIALVECQIEVPVLPDVCSPRAFSADTSLPADYYDRAEGKQGLALLDALHDITCTQRVLDYEHTRDSLYDYVDDPNADNLISDLYTGRVATVDSRASAAAADFNTEHIWPRSRGAEDEPALTDLHHLFTADETANGKRLNYPFGEVTGTVLWESPADSAGDHSLQGYDAQGRIVFEPRDAVKGDIARALLYFYVRYHDSPGTSFSLANFNVEEGTLRAWAAADPPDTFEQQRNALIFRAQGNRNPFVDRPEFLNDIPDFPNQ